MKISSELLYFSRNSFLVPEWAAATPKPVDKKYVIKATGVPAARISNKWLWKQIKQLAWNQTIIKSNHSWGNIGRQTDTWNRYLIAIKNSGNSYLESLLLMNINFTPSLTGICYNFFNGQWLWKDKRNMQSNNAGFLKNYNKFFEAGRHYQTKLNLESKRMKRLLNEVILYTKSK